MTMRRDISDRLDSVDSLKPGTGSLDAFIFGTGGIRSGSLGLGLDVEYKFNSGISAFAEAEAAYQYGQNAGLGFNLQAGIRGLL